MVIILKPLWREGCSLMTPASLLSLPDEEETNSFRCTQGILVPSAWVGHLPWAGGPQVRVFFFWLQDRFYAHLWEILFLSSKGKLITTALGPAQGYPGITRHHTTVPPSRQPGVLPVHSGRLSHSLNNLHLKPGLVAWMADFYILRSTWIPFLSVPQVPQAQLFLPPPMDLLQLMESSPSQISRGKTPELPSFNSVHNKKKILKNCCLYFLKKMNICGLLCG